MVGGRWTGFADRFRETCADRPRRTGVVIAASALLGLPPFGLVVVLAGLTRVPLVLLVPASVVSRVVRFSAIAAIPQLVELWWV